MSPARILIIGGNYKELASAIPRGVKKTDYIHFDGKQLRTDFTKYDMILLDSGNNVEKGLEILEKVKKISPGSFVIFITDHGTEDYAVKAFRLGARDYVRKPIHRQELKNTLTELLKIKTISLEQRQAILIPEFETAGLLNIDETKNETTVWHKIIVFIHENLKDDVSVEDLAGIAQLSKFHFIRKFKTLTGLTPKEYIILKRIEKAKELLRAGGMKVTEISLEVGFNDVSNFAHHFKSLTGFTPSQFRKTNDTGLFD